MFQETFLKSIIWLDSKYLILQTCIYLETNLFVYLLTYRGYLAAAVMQ